MIVIVKQQKYGLPTIVEFLKASDMPGLIRSTMDHAGDVTVYDVRDETVTTIYPMEETTS